MPFHRHIQFATRSTHTPLPPTSLKPTTTPSSSKTILSVSRSNTTSCSRAYDTHTHTHTHDNYMHVSYSVVSRFSPPTRPLSVNFGALKIHDCFCKLLEDAYSKCEASQGKNHVECYTWPLSVFFSGVPCKAFRTNDTEASRCSKLPERAYGGHPTR